MRKLKDSRFSTKIAGGIAGLYSLIIASGLSSAGKAVKKADHELSSSNFLPVDEICRLVPYTRSIQLRTMNSCYRESSFLPLLSDVSIEMLVECHMLMAIAVRTIRPASRRPSQSLA